jgi:hypothetical protein
VTPKTMKAEELRDKLSALITSGRAGEPVYVQVVYQGVTFALPIIGAIESNPADGELIWLLPGDLRPPMWNPQPVELSVQDKS